MTGPGNDLTTLMKSEGSATAQNLKLTAANLGEHEKVLKACLAHQEAATGGSSRPAMRRLRELVHGVLGREKTGTEAVASAGQRCQKIADDL